jgi:ubiquitin-small subunit ribosomal protein S27Ae
MAKKPKPKNKQPSKKYSKYQIEGDKITRRPTCPKCGAGVFLAEHPDRLHCGRCGYVEFKTKKV